MATHDAKGLAMDKWKILRILDSGKYDETYMGDYDSREAYEWYLRQAKLDNTIAIVIFKSVDDGKTWIAQSAYNSFNQ